MNIPEFTLPKLSEKYIDGRRHYITPDGNMYPSITTVLSADPEKKKSLQVWRDKVGEERANRICQRAAKRGTAMHLICERYIDEEEDYTREAMPDAISMFRSIKPFIDETEKVILQEAQLFSDKLKTAGRCDLLGVWRDKVTVVDFKQSNKPKKREWIDNYFMQSSFYSYAFYEMTGIPVTQIAIMVAVENARPQLFVEKPRDWIEQYWNLRQNYDRL